MENKMEAKLFILALLNEYNMFEYVHYMEKKFGSKCRLDIKAFCNYLFFVHFMSYGRQKYDHSELIIEVEFSEKYIDSKSLKLSIDGKILLSSLMEKKVLDIIRSSYVIDFDKFIFLENKNMNNYIYLFLYDRISNFNFELPLMSNPFLLCRHTYEFSNLESPPSFIIFPGKLLPNKTLSLKNYTHIQKEKTDRNYFIIGEKYYYIFCTDLGYVWGIFQIKTYDNQKDIYLTQYLETSDKNMYIEGTFFRDNPGCREHYKPFNLIEPEELELLSKLRILNSLTNE